MVEVEIRLRVQHPAAVVDLDPVHRAIGYLRREQELAVRTDILAGTQGGPADDSTGRVGHDHCGALGDALIERCEPASTVELDASDVQRTLDAVVTTP